MILSRSWHSDWMSHAIESGMQGVDLVGTVVWIMVWYYTYLDCQLLVIEIFHPKAFRQSFSS